MENYGNIWDRYVTDQFPKIKNSTPHALKTLEQWRVLNTKDLKYEWPGDEWADADTVKKLFDQAIVINLDDEPGHLCEIGAGSGRYTKNAFENFPNSTILSFDVSVEFEKSLRERLAKYVESNQLKTFIIEADPFYIIKTISQLNLINKLDVVYSFDSMVHVDLHTLLIYWLSATIVLKKNGLLVMNVANACNENGFAKLVHDAKTGYKCSGNAGNHFMWISKDIVDSILSKLGFRTYYHEGNGRDLTFSAKLVYPQMGEKILKGMGLNMDFMV